MENTPRYQDMVRILAKDLISIIREETIAANEAKLAKRYNGQYSNQQAQDRADKKE